MADFREPLTQTIATFLREIGIPVRPADLPGATFLPGIAVETGGLLVDEARMRFPGDLLHEAGHIAVAPAERRPTMSGDVTADPAEEMMAIAWSYAALVHLGLDPAVVFHPEGYKGGSQSMIENFGEGRYLGLPMLQWVGLAADERRAADLGVAPYPAMIAWLRA